MAQYTVCYSFHLHLLSAVNAHIRFYRYSSRFRPTTSGTRDCHTHNIEGKVTTDCWWFVFTKTTKRDPRLILKSYNYHAVSNSELPCQYAVLNTRAILNQRIKSPIQDFKGKGDVHMGPFTWSDNDQRSALLSSLSRSCHCMWNHPTEPPYTIPSLELAPQDNPSLQT